MQKVVKIAGRILLVAGLALDALEIGLTIYDDLHDADGKLGKKTLSTIVSIGGSWGGTRRCSSFITDRWNCRIIFGQRAGKVGCGYYLCGGLKNEFLEFFKMDAFKEAAACFSDGRLQSVLR